MEHFFQPLSITLGTLIERKRLLREKKQHRDELYQAAHYDSLTQLPNRRRLMQYLDQLMGGEDEQSIKFAVCFIDLDGFKGVNDTLGHDAGDLVIKTIADNLHAKIRGEDFLARSGGDEFVLILRGEQSDLSYQRVLDAVAQPIEWKGREIRLTASMGVTCYPCDIDSADGLLRHADQAMYLAKDLGKNRFMRFEPEQEKYKRERFALLEALEKGLSRKEIKLYLQPKVDLDSGETFAFEVLVRWLHPAEGLLFPDQFLPQIAETALMSSLDRYVLDAAAEMIQQGENRGDILRLAVNITPVFIVSDAFDEAIHSLEKLDIAIRSRITLEIIESTLLSDMDLAISRLERCKVLGLNISLDDFGTSFSSLTYFRSLPADEIKIDKSFVIGMLDNDEDAKLVESIIGIAKSFNRSVIAEGVESEGHVIALQKLGCDKGQGYFYSAPKPAAEFIG